MMNQSRGALGRPPMLRGALTPPVRYAGGGAVDIPPELATMSYEDILALLQAQQGALAPIPGFNDGGDAGDGGDGGDGDGGDSGDGGDEGGGAGESAGGGQAGGGGGPGSGGGYGDDGTGSSAGPSGGSAAGSGSAVGGAGTGIGDLGGEMSATSETLGSDLANPSASVADLGNEMAATTQAFADLGLDIPMSNLADPEQDVLGRAADLLGITQRGRDLADLFSGKVNPTTIGTVLGLATPLGTAIGIGRGMSTIGRGVSDMLGLAYEPGTTDYSDPSNAPASSDEAYAADIAPQGALDPTETTTDPAASQTWLNTWMQGTPGYASGGSVPAGAFVIPADVVAARGDGSSRAGALTYRALGGRVVDGPGTGRSDSIVRKGPRGALALSRDEVVIPPSGVRKAGGSGALDRHVMQTREEYRQKLGALPPPRGAREHGKRNGGAFADGGEVEPRRGSMLAMRQLYADPTLEAGAYEPQGPSWGDLGDMWLASQAEDAEAERIADEAFRAKRLEAGDWSYAPETMGPFAEKVIEGLGMNALKVGNVAAKVAPKTGAALIKNWKWRPVQEVQQELGLTKIPPHVEEFGDFMKEQAARAASGDLGARDLIKAFTTTRASIQRQGVQADKVRAAGLPLADDVTGKVRPEGAFAEWLFTPGGQRYLNAAERGEVDETAIAEAVKIMAPFGKHEKDIPKALRSAALNVGPRADEAREIIARVNAGEPGAVAEWRKFAKSLPGIGPAKQGFVGSLVGNGALPTLDARQIKAHTGRPTKEANKYLNRRSGRGADAAVDRLARRQEAMNLDVRDDLKPFYQHLTHHAIWDKAGNEVTTHADLMRAMRSAGLIPAIGAGALGLQMMPTEEPAGALALPR